MDIRNPTYTQNGSIDCEINHPDFGWIPFTASQDDPEPHGRAIFAAASQMAVDPWVEPDPEPPYVPTKISRFQARAALLHLGLLSNVEAAVAESDAITQLAWAETIEWQRNSPTLNRLAKEVLGMADEDIDDMFIFAAEITA